MAEIDNLLKALAQSEKEEQPQNNNDDLDLGAVFAFFSTDYEPHEVVFPDGKTGHFKVM